MDERGFVRIVDRKKDMILVSGFNVYPNEIEAVVAMHPGRARMRGGRRARREVGRGGQALRRQEGSSALTAEDVLRALPRAPDRLQVPARRRIPRRSCRRSNVGKILRRELRDEARKAGGMSAHRDARATARRPTTRHAARPRSRRCASCRCRPTPTSTATSSAAGSCRRSTSPAAFPRRGARAAGSRRSRSIRSCSSSRC